ncbi:MAG: hypothetical protein K9H64_13525 [Bacteroidales bacterium]|nr:hypothetical protein [Bacteroidales bacterium]MCF8456373.1 hypothetical protein [Bacteroidales bacterium]
MITLKRISFCSQCVFSLLIILSCNSKHQKSPSNHEVDKGDNDSELIDVRQYDQNTGQILPKGNEVLIYKKIFSSDSTLNFEYYQNPKEGWTTLLDILGSTLLLSVKMDEEKEWLFQFLNISTNKLDIFSLNDPSYKIVGGSLRSRILYIQSDSKSFIYSIDRDSIIRNFNISDLREINYIDDSLQIYTLNEHWENYLLSEKKRYPNGLLLKPFASKQKLYFYSQKDYGGFITEYDLNSDQKRIIIDLLPLDGIYSNINDSLFVVTDQINQNFPTVLLNVKSKMYLDLLELLDMNMFSSPCMDMFLTEDKKLFFVSCSGEFATVSLNDLLIHPNWQESNLEIY